MRAGRFPLAARSLQLRCRTRFTTCQSVTSLRVDDNDQLTAVSFTVVQLVSCPLINCVVHVNDGALLMCSYRMNSLTVSARKIAWRRPTTVVFVNWWYTREDIQNYKRKKNWRKHSTVRNKYVTCVVVIIVSTKVLCYSTNFSVSFFSKFGQLKSKEASGFPLQGHLLMLVCC